ncbi:MAG: PAC2 family protein [Nanoarchaeota archaeon]|nr:PAC2 family protein [Nanoarchaeota archaeon]
MSAWRIDQFGKKPNLSKTVLIEGLPGIGNVGKVAIDFIVDELGAKKIYEITSHTFPNSVFVNEKNLVELPKIEIFYKKCKDNDLLLMGGDVQPIDEISSYDFAEKILDIAESFKAKQIITLGGIGLAEIPKTPKLYCTGNCKQIIKKYKSRGVNDQLYGIVGPIVGVSGLLLGLATRRNINSVSLLAETYGHPMYLGVKGAREILKILNHELGLSLNVDKLEKEIDYIENQGIKGKEEVLPKHGVLKRTKKGEVSYIG